MRTTLWAVLLTALCTSLVGTWVVLRGMSFLGDALAHGVLPGIAIAFVIGGNTTVGAFLAALAMVAGINIVRSASPLPDDASIGILFVGFLSLAVVIMSSAASGLRRRPQPLPVRLDHRRRHRPTSTASSSPRRSPSSAVVVLLPRLPRRHVRRAPGGGARAAPAARPRRAARAARGGDRLVVRHRRQPARVRLPRRPAGDGDAVRRRVPTVMAVATVIGVGRRRRRPADQLPPRHRGRGDDGAVHGRRVLRRARRPVGVCWCSAAARPPDATAAAGTLRGMADARLEGTEIADSVIDLIGNTPLVRLKRVSELEALPCVLAMKMETIEPRRLVEGPPGVGDDPRRRARRPAPARRHDRRADERQHRRRPGHRRRPARLPLRVRDDRQGGAGEDLAAARLRRRGRRLPGRRRSRGSRRATTRSPPGSPTSSPPSGPTSTPTRPTRWPTS